MTEKLYYIDSHAFEFTANVLECVELDGGYAIILDRTAFFPEGGGQAADTGYIGSVRVSDVQERRNEILHYTETPLERGTYQCRIDAEQRLRRMQNHSGEHIVSGIVHKLYGFENVGFHMGADCMTIDFSGELDWAQLMDVERRANEIVRANLPVIAWFPAANELDTLHYRSKLELTEDVRLVKIGDIDLCACCAPHVTRTGEVGVIKIFTCERHRGGVRVTLLCGMDALDDYRRRQDSAAAVSQLLSVPRDDIEQAVRRVLNEQTRLKERMAELSHGLVAALASTYGFTNGNICIFDDILEEAALRELVNLLVDKCTGFAAVFSGDDANGYKYIIGSKHCDLRAAAREINAAIGGRGGGRPEMIQGSAFESREKVQKFVENAHV